MDIIAISKADPSYGIILSMKILVTGGAGFIGSAVIRYLINDTDCEVINLDKLTYAGNLESLDSVAKSDRYYFEQADICDREALDRIFSTHQPDAVMHLAAESHVDRSIDGPGDFIQTNLVGTYVMLDASRTVVTTCFVRIPRTTQALPTRRPKLARITW